MSKATPKRQLLDDPFSPALGGFGSDFSMNNGSSLSLLDDVLDGLKHISVESTKKQQAPPQSTTNLFSEMKRK
jgi:hypothetical protein